MKLSRLSQASLGAAALLLAAASSQAAITTLGFDGAVDTDITSDYAGLTFRAPAAGTGPVRTWAWSGADTAGNVLGVAARFDITQTESAIDILFDTAVNSVSIRAAFLVASDFAFRTSGNPFMSVYNSDTFSAATRIALDEWSVVGDACLTLSFCQSAWDTLQYDSSTSNIKGIRLSGFAANPNEFARRAIFDTLSYGDRAGGGGGGGGGNVPEPASALLASAALLALWGARRRNPRVQRTLTA
jgi:hypothetical protein